MKMFAMSVLFVSLSAHAHIAPGIYTGVTDTGEACAMKAGATTFENGLHHPLAERFALEVDATEFSAGHPSAVDVKDVAVTFNHNLVQGLKPTSQGAQALVVTMVHSEEFEGPTDYTFIDDNWVKETKSAKHCGRLKLTTGK